MKKFFSGYKNIMLHGKPLDKFLSWGLIFLLLIAIFSIVKATVIDVPPKAIPASTFLTELDHDNIKKMDICYTDGGVEGEFREAIDGNTKFTTIVAQNSNVLTQVYLDELNKSRQKSNENYEVIEYTYSKESKLVTVITTLITFAIEFGLIIVLFVWILKRNGGGGLFGVGDMDSKIKADIPDASFDDIAGIPEAIEEISEVVAFLKNPKIYNDVGADFPKGILLQGPGGTGKTALARALAGEAGVPFIHASGSDFVELYVGMGSARVRKIFKKAKEVSPSILFIDEIDAVGTDRDNGNFASSEHLQTINALLAEMDGFDKSDSVIVIGATNRADALDKALLRPGRFDRIVSVDTPSKDGRIEILRLYAQGKTFAEEVDFEKLAKDTYGFSGAQLKNCMNEAAALAARRAADDDKFPKITMKDLDEGISRTISGPAMKSKKMCDEEKRITAYHESSHALVQYMLPECDNVQKISIVSRYMPDIGPALGYVQSYSEDDQYVTTSAKCEDEIAALLAGRCGEKLFCNLETAGASNDLERASELAYNMVDKFAFSGEWNESLRTEVKDSRTQLIKAGPDRLNKIDQGVELILNNSYNKAYNILSNNKDKVHKLAKMLLEKEVIDGSDIENIIGN